MSTDSRGSDIDESRDVLAVIGAGAWGTALAALEAPRFRRVDLFTPEASVVEEINRFHSNSARLPDLVLPSNVIATGRLEEAVRSASTVIIAVPSGAFREVARVVRPSCPRRARVVLATKGMETGTSMLSLEVWRELAAAEAGRRRRDALVLSGPNLAVEISRGMPAVSSIAGTDASEVRRAARDLSTGLLALVPFGDPLGAQAFGAMKNVYAIGCGMCAALSWGDNANAAILWRGLDETGRFARAIGATSAVVGTPAGAGDFVATCASPLSRNHDLGRVVAGAGGGEVSGVREGASTALAARRRCRGLGLELPLLEAVCSVLLGERKPLAVLEAACGAGEAGTRGQDARTASAGGPAGAPAATIKRSWQVAGSD